MKIDRCPLNKFVAISDIHFNLQNQKPAAETLRQALVLAREKMCALFIGGDVNDTKAVIRSETIKSLLGLFNEFADVAVWIVVGNHDLENHNGESHSLLFLKELDNVKVVDETMATHHTRGWGIIPYTHSKEKFKASLDTLKTCGIRRLLIHQGVKGAMMSEYAVDESSVTIGDFDGFDLVISGHYHMHQWVGDRFMYWGSPYTTRFDEASHSKYIYYVTTEPKINVEKIPTNVRRHYQFEVETMEQIAGLDKVPPESLVKLVVKGDRQFVASITKEKAREILGVQNVSIVPSITRKLTYRMDVTAATNPRDVVMGFLRKSETERDKQALENYIKAVMA